MRKSLLFVAVVAAIGLPGCVRAIKQSEVDTTLRSAGFSQEDARCLAARAARRLSVGQLRSLQRAAASFQQPVRETTIGDAIDGVRTHVDSATIRILVQLGDECIRARVQEKVQQRSEEQQPK